MFSVTKTYGHELGLSAVFRQHRANSHCSKLHGYALAFEFEFTCQQLDENGWVIDFGDLQVIKHWLYGSFDHKVLIAEDDPQRITFESLAHGLKFPIMDLVVVPRVGCEAFARLAFDHVSAWLAKSRDAGARKVLLKRCTVREHGANAATYHA